MGQRIVYISCADPREIHAFAMDGETGAMTPLAVTFVSGLADASPSMPLAISPDRRVLYAGLRLPPFPVVSFKIDPADGALHLVGSAPLPLSHTSLTVDRSGQWLLSASYPDAVLALTRIAPSGAAEAPATTIAGTLPKAHNVLVSPDNRFVYVTCLGGDAVLRWGFDPKLGLLEPDSPAIAPSHAPGAGPRHMAFGRDAAMLYVINELDGTIDAFARDRATGSLSLCQSIPCLPQDARGQAAAADLHVTPDGQRLFASLRCDSTIVAFRIADDGGRLSLIGRTAVEDTPRGFAITPDGRFLVCAGRNSASAGVYRIEGPDGSLTRLQSVATGENANWVEIIDLA